MLLRSGLRVGGIDKAESSSMDTSSTRAEPGSPHHTNRFVEQMLMGGFRNQTLIFRLLIQFLYHKFY
jgi:hypothetical protein